MKKHIIILVTNLLLCLIMNAQSLERQVISTTGNYSTATDIQLSSTVGELMIETFISGSVIFTQGFQQADDNIVAVSGPVIVLDYKIYPNPTKDRIFLNLSSDKQLNLSLRLVDMTGRSTGIGVEDIQVNGYIEQELDLSPLTAGTYLLQILDVQNQIRKTVKVVKYQQ